MVMTFDFVVFHIIVRIVYFSLLLHDITSLIFFFLAGKADQEGEEYMKCRRWGREMRIKLTPGQEVEKQNKKRFLVLQDVKSRQKTPNTSDLTFLY